MGYTNLKRILYFRFSQRLLCVITYQCKGNQSWILLIGRTDAEAEAPILWPPDMKNWLHWKRSWCWERLKAGGEGDDRGWGGWMASPTRWTWVWASSRNWWWTGKPSMLHAVHGQITKCWPLLLLLLSRFSRVRLSATPWIAADQAPPSMGFPGKSTAVGCHCLLRVGH